MAKNRFQRSSVGYALAGFAVAAVAACGDDTAGFEDPLVGGNGGASGWTFVPGAGDASTAGKVGSGGSLATAGSGPGAGSAGRAGSGNGTSGAGGASLPPVTFECGGKVPNQPVITSFDAFMGDRWTSPGNLDGGVYIYPEPLKVAAGDFLRFDAQVETYTGIGAWFSGCIDGSPFTGVRLTVSGNVGTTGSVQFYLVTNRDRDVDEGNGVGACVPDDPANAWQDCRPPVYMLPVTAVPTEHSIPWTAFAGGLPSAKTDGSDLLALQWTFDWIDANQSTAYPAQLTVDNLQFYVDDVGPGEGGAGGTGGSGAGTGGSGAGTGGSGAGTGGTSVAGATVTGGTGGDAP